MRNQHNIAGVGEVLWDSFPEGDLFGGAPANFACHCHSLGANAYVVSCLGNDKRGQDARAFLDAHGVDTSCLTTSNERETGVVIVTLDEQGLPTYEIKENAAWDAIPWTREADVLAGKLDAVCFGSLGQRNAVSRATIQTFLAATRDECLRVFDINLRQTFYTREIIEESLQAASAVKLNDEELTTLGTILDRPNLGEEAALAALLGQYDLRLAILTKGDAGSLMITPTESSVAKAPAITPVNTVGAGDAFTAAAVMGFLDGKALDEINQHANAVAAWVCTQNGAAPALPEALNRN